MASISSIDKDFIVTIQDSLKDCILHIKSEIQVIQRSKEENLYKKSDIVLLKNG